MLKRELKVNFKSFIIWLLVLIIMFLIVYLVYPYIITDESMKSIDEMMQIFPEKVLKAFNMDMSSISTAYGWLKTEGFTFVLLIVGLYASLLGGNILLKEENDKTIEYLGSLPIKRSQIITNKMIIGFFYIVMMVLLLGLFNYMALSISGDFNHKQFILLSLTPLLIAIPFFCLNLFLSTFFRKNKKIMGISLGMVFIFYLCSVLSELSDKVAFLKYFSLYSLADIRNVIANVSINGLLVVICLGISLLFLCGTYIRYLKKEFF